MKSIKTYKSASVPHFSVGNARVAFIPLAGQGSYYETDDEDLQRAMEKHPWFGSKFGLEKTELIEDGCSSGEDPEQTGPSAVDGCSSGEEPEQAEVSAIDGEGDGNGPEELHFATLADAKEFLAVKFEVPRSNVRNIATAVEIGKANGVDIVIGK